MIKSFCQGSIYPSSTKKSFSISWYSRCLITTLHIRNLFCLVTKTLLDGYSIFYKNWFEKGVFLIQDLLDIDSNDMPYTKFTEKYLLSCNFLAYFQVVSAIPKDAIERKGNPPL